MKKNVPLSEDVLSLWWGFIDETYNPWIISELIAKAISDRGYNILQYNDSLWLPELRKHGSDFLKKSFWIDGIQNDEIMITNGATAGIDLAGRYVLQWKYDSIALIPVYDTALESLKRNSKDVLTVELWIFEGESMIDWNKLDDLMSRQDTKLIYLNTNFQNPTWVVFDEETKKKIYELAKKHWVTILEDDPYKLYNFQWQDLWWNIVNMDKGKEYVVYLNSISKVFYPWMRIGFLVWNRELVHGISELQKYSTSIPNLIMQWASIEAFERGEIDKSITHYMREVWEKSDIITQALVSKGLIWETSPIQFSDSRWGF